MNNTPEKSNKVEVDMSLGDKINEFLDPILGEKQQLSPLFWGGLVGLGYLATGLPAIIALQHGAVTALANIILRVRFFKGKRSTHNVK